MAFDFDASTAQPVDGAAGQFDPSTAAPVNPRGPISEIANQFKAGTLVDLPQMAGQALQFTSSPGNTIYELGKRISQSAEERGQRPDLQPDEANHNVITNALASGARMIPQSVVPAALAGGAIAALPFEVPAAAALGAASIAGAVPAALSQGQQTLDKAEKAGVAPDVATEAARKTALIEGAGEALGNYAGGKLVTGIGKPISAYAARLLGIGEGGAAANALGEATGKQVIKPWLKQIPETAIVETGTEMGQNAGEAQVEREAGIDNTSPAEAAQQAIAPTLGMTALLAPFGLAGHAIQAHARRARASVLSNAQADPQERMTAAAQIGDEIAAVDPQAAQNFTDHAQRAIATQQPIPIGEHLLVAPDQPAGPVTSALMRALPAPKVVVDTEGNARKEGVEPPVQDEGAANVVGRAPVEVPPASPTLALPPPTITVDELGRARAPGQKPVQPLPGPYEIGRFGEGRNSELVEPPAAAPPAALQAPTVTVDSAGNSATPGDRQALRRAADAERERRISLGLPLKPGAEARGRNADITDVEAKNAETIPHSLAPGDLDAHAGATSPLNTRTEPTEPQKDAGNYKLGHVRIGGMGFSVENAEGSTRSGTAPDGTPWSTTMTAHYGYQKGTQGADSTDVKKQGRDVFIKPGTPSNWNGNVFVVDQVDPSTGKFDEHKSVVGASSEAEARDLYLSNYEPGWKGLGAITPMSIPEFKKWSYDHDTRNEPVAQLPPPAEVSQQADAIAQPKPLTLGMTPNNAEPVTVRDGVIHIGDKPAINFETGDPVQAPDGASHAQLKAALKDAGAVSRRQRFFGGDVAESKQTPNGVQADAKATPNEPSISSSTNAIEKTDKGEPSTRTPVSDRVGVDGVSIAEGGKPFSSRLNAVQFKNKNMPQGRVVKHEDGFAVRPATDREIEARAQSGDNLRRKGDAAKYEKNPLLHWLGGMGGLSPKTKGDLSPDKNPFVRGGPLFRNGGRELDVLAANAAQDGFLPPGSSDARQLYDMVSRAIRGERIAPVYGQGQAETEAQRRAPVEDFDEHAALEASLEREAIQAANDLTPDQLEALADTWESDENASEEDAMRALGFTEDEIHAALNTATGTEAETGKGHSATGEPLTRGPPQGAASREGDQGRSEGGLTAREESPSYGRQWPDLHKALEAYDDTGDIETVRDLADHVEQLVDEDKAPKELQGAVDKLRDDVDEDYREWGGRGDVDTYEEEFLQAVRSALAAKHDLAGAAPSDSQQKAGAMRAQKAERDREQQQKAPGSGEFHLTGSDREADEGASRGQQPLFESGQQDNSGRYETDLFGNPIPRQQALPDAGSNRPRAARPVESAVPGDAHAEGAVRDTATPAGNYYVNTLVGSERKQRLGAAVIHTPADAAQATAYLYKSPVERLDAIVTDAQGKPLAIVGGFKGAVTQTSVYPGTIVAEAVRVEGAKHVWFSHNHPSGSAELSRADEALAAKLADTFEGSGIQSMGLLAVSGNKFSVVKPDESIERGTIAPGRSLLQVPIVDRELRDERQAPVAIDSPVKALHYSIDMYRRAQTPGLLMLDAQNYIAAWVPLPEVTRGKLRDTGGLNTIYRAVSHSNASSAIIVHGGELDRMVHHLGADENISRALARMDVHVLDVVDAKNGTSAQASGTFHHRNNDGNAPMFRRGETAGAGMTRTELHTSLAQAFGPGVAQRLLGKGVLVPVADQRSVPDHVIPFLREGDKVFGFFDPYTDKTYAVLSNLTPDMVRSLALHEIGVHYGFESMLGRPKYAQVLQRIAQMGKEGNEAVLEAREAARRESANSAQIPEETLAYLVHHYPELDLIASVISAIKAWAFRTFGIGANRLTLNDIATLAHASVIHASRENAAERKPQFLKAAFSRTGAVQLDANLAQRSAEDLIPYARAVAMQRFAGTTVHNVSDGSEIMIPGSGIKHAFSGNVSPIAAAAATRLDDVISRAQFVRSEADKKGRNTIKEIRHYEVAVQAGDQRATLGVVVRVAHDGSRYYDHFELKEKAPAGQSGEQASPDSHRPFTGAVPSKPGEDSVKQDRAPYFARTTFADLTAQQRSALERVGGVVPDKTVKQRFAELRANFGERVRTGLVDQFAPIKNLGEHAYMLARLSKGGDGTMEAAMLYGRPYLNGNAPDVDVKDGGFAKVLASLKGEHDRFLWWVAAQRAERLKAQGRENLFSDNDISDLKTLRDGNFADGTARAPVYDAALTRLNEFNEASLKMALDSGLITQEAFDVMKEQPYVPFYRVMEEDGGLKFSARGGLVNQSAYKQLKGGSEKLNNDLLQNMLLNWSHIFTASARNRAAQAAMSEATKLTIAYPVPAGTKGAIKVKEAGVDVHYAVEDPYLMEAISALHYVPSELLKPLQATKHYLTLGVTANPAFKIRNLIRDSIAAAGQSELSLNIAKNIAQGWKKTAKDSQVFASMLAAGGVIRFGAAEDTNRVRRQIEHLGGELLDANGFKKLSNQVVRAWEAYQELGDRGENVNRVALYEQLVAKGTSHAEAAFMARDLLDFSMGGQWGAIRFLTQTVPFLNARLQGLYKLGRAAAEDPRRFGIVTGAVMLASTGLWYAWSGDDDWKKREDWDRDTYWWFKIGAKAFRIPKPFEIGAIGTLAERTAELAFDKEMTTQRYRQRLSNMFFQTFSFDPTPQIIKPIFDVYANKDSFTQRPIESTADARVQPQDRVSERTSEVARLLGQLGLPNPAELAKGEWADLSPKQIDFLLRGYFGWLGTAALTASDYTIRPMTDRGARPAMQLHDAFLAGNFVESLPAGQSRYVTAMYDQAKAVEQAYGSWQAALRRGDPEEAARIFKDEAPNIRVHAQVEAVKRTEGLFNAQARHIEASKTMSADEKRDRLAELERRRDAIARTLAPAQ